MYYFISFNEFGCALSFKDISTDDVQMVEQFVREDLLQIVNATVDEIENKQKLWFFGLFSSNPSEFMFLPDEKRGIYALSNHIKIQANQLGERQTMEYFSNSSVIDKNNLCESVFGLVFASKCNVPCDDTTYAMWSDQTDENDVSNDNDIATNNELQPVSQTHTLLNKMLQTANQNYLRTKPGYRFGKDTKLFATYIRYLAGPLTYSTLHQNMALAIPSLSTINRFAAKTSSWVFDAQLRCKELLKYLTDRHLPLKVAIAEDATVIDGRIQYDSRCNQYVGFVAPLDGNGMPIPNSFPARNCTEIISHFSTGKEPAKYVTVVMAQPLAKFPPFCLFLFASNTKETAESVVKRKDFISNELAKFNIETVTFSSDSHPIYNSAMTKKSKLGCASNIFIDYKADYEAKITAKKWNWFCSGLSESYKGPFDFQDHNHIATKLRNLFLKT